MFRQPKETEAAKAQRVPGKSNRQERP